MDRDRAQAILEAAQANAGGGLPFDVFSTENGPVNVAWKDMLHRAVAVRKNENGAFVNSGALPNAAAGTALYLGTVAPNGMKWPATRYEEHGMASYEDLEKLSRDRKRDALMVTADIGKANGMRAGAEILRAIANGRKTVSSAELLAAAMTMEEAAHKVDAKANAAMEALNEALNAKSSKLFDEVVIDYSGS